MKFQSALAALAIRKELKAAGIKASVTSKKYSSGSSVNVEMLDQAPEIKKLAESIAYKHQYGHFDGMTDSYEYSNSRDDIAQAKFVFVHNHMSPDFEQKVYDYLRSEYQGGDQLPATYQQGCNTPFHGCYVNQLCWRLFNGSNAGFWPEQSIAA